MILLYHLEGGKNHQVNISQHILKNVECTFIIYTHNHDKLIGKPIF